MGDLFSRMSFNFGSRKLSGGEVLKAVNEKTERSEAGNGEVERDYFMVNGNPVVKNLFTYYDEEGIRLGEVVVEATYDSLNAKLKQGRFKTLSGAFSTTVEDYVVRFDPPGSFFGKREDLIRGDSE